MSVDVPSSWRALRQVAIPLDDITGLPGMPAAPAPERARAVIGAFAPVPPAPSGRHEAVDRFQVMATRAVRWTGADRVSSVAPPGVGAVAGLLPPEALAGDADVRRVHRLVSATGVHTVLQQQVRGHDVVGGRLLVHQDVVGAYSVTGRPIGDLGARDPGPPPAVDRDRARAEILDRFPVRFGTPVEPRLVVLPVEGSARWAWTATASLGDPVVDVRVFLAPGTYDPLVVYPVSVTAYGEAMLHPINPTRSTAGPERVCLRDLDDVPDGPLRGPWVAVDAGGETPFTSAHRDYTVADDDPRIDQVATYHHLSAGLRWFGERVRPELFEQPMFRPLHAVAHDPYLTDNAQFDPVSARIVLGEVSATGRGFATSVDMVLHELAHAVVHAICRLSDTPVGQPRSLNEGYSDYFAATYIGGPEIGDHVNPGGARSCANPHLPSPPPLDGDDPYPLGEVWANVLWGIRGALGAAVTDALVIESLYFAQTLVSVEEGLGALHLADAALFPVPGDAVGGRGRHAEVIDAQYAARFG